MQAIVDVPMHVSCIIDSTRSRVLVGVHLALLSSNKRREGTSLTLTIDDAIWHCLTLPAC